jgi:DNA helicase-2/ATP-dependent DNA helicase PcrA
MFDLGENARDEGPVCNLGLISQYLSRYLEEYPPMLTGRALSDGSANNGFFSSYLYSLFRRGESEFEDAEDPFPRGRIPFLTIHQAKGLEFPVMVLGNPRKNTSQVQRVEKLVHPLIDHQGEPPNKMPLFDAMRMFYVAISRAKNLVVIARYKGAGHYVNPEFEPLISTLPHINQLKTSKLPVATPNDQDVPRNYSYTADYLLYRKCARQYMIFRKYEFAPSRSQTMFFGSLVHQTIEDLHQRLMRQRPLANAA